MATKKFKVGDKVRVKSLEWYNENKDSIGYIPIGQVFTDAMSKYCGSILTIKEIFEDFYIVNENTKNWQDWMLEDEVITEKQEVEQLNQSDMETKEMTKQEALDFLKDTKILCTSKAETIQVQVKLFQFGIEWISKAKGVQEDKYLLFINKRQELQHCSEIEYWMEDVNRRIEPSEILAIQIKEEKPKFDPKSLRPFDKVLVRDKEGDKWRCNLFCYINEELGCSYFCLYDNWKYCTPYNEDTKHLAGTNEEAPEFYRIE